MKAYWNLQRAREEVKAAGDDPAKIAAAKAHVEIATQGLRDAVAATSPATEIRREIAEKHEESTEKRFETEEDRKKKHDEDVQKRFEEEEARKKAHEAETERLARLKAEPAPESVSAVADLIGMYKMPPMSGWVLSTPYGQQTMAAVKQKYPDYDAAEWTTRQAVTKAKGTAEVHADTAALTQLVKQQAAIETFSNTAVKNGRVLIQLGEKVDKTGIPVIEHYRREGAKSLGDPDVAEFYAQLKTYSAEAAKILTNPNMVGVLTIEAQRDIDKFLGGDISAKQLKRVVSRLETDFKFRTESINEDIVDFKARIEGKPVPERSSAAPPAAPPVPPSQEGWSIKKVQ